MNTKATFLIGSSSAKNAQRIRLPLDGMGDCVVVESWEEFKHNSITQDFSVQITDLNLIDCFPFVVLNNILEQPYRAPMMILLEDNSNYALCRERVYLPIEILPIEIVEDDRFASVIDATRARFDFLNELI